MKRDFKKILEELKTVRGQLSEAYIFNGKEGYEDVYQDETEQVPQEEPMPQEQVGDGESAEEVAMHAQEVIQHEPIIGRIRETAIEGLKKYADNPTSALYEFFKKVFLESDKVLTDTGNKK
jgi:hypothetical protein